jgi:hypothetical protein
MRTTVKVKAKINRAHIKKKVSQGTRRSLPGAGVIVQRSARKQFSSRNVKKTPKWSRVGSRDGRPVLAMEFRPPIPGKITSWKNPRGRGATKTGFLRTLIRFEVDNRRESVVIGPTNEATWLNRLQEFGGTGRRVLKLIGRAPDRRQKNRLLQKFKPPSSMLTNERGPRQARDKSGRFRRGRAYVGIWIDPDHTRSRRGISLASESARVPPGRFMKKGLDAKRDQLARQWKDRIYGP